MDRRDLEELSDEQLLDVLLYVPQRSTDSIPTNIPGSIERLILKECPEYDQDQLPDGLDQPPALPLFSEDQRRELCDWLTRLLSNDSCISYFYVGAGNPADPIAINAVKLIVLEAAAAQPGQAEAWKTFFRLRESIEADPEETGDGNKRSMTRAPPLGSCIKKTRAEEAVELDDHTRKLLYLCYYDRGLLPPDVRKRHYVCGSCGSKLELANMHGEDCGCPKVSLESWIEQFHPEYHESRWHSLGVTCATGERLSNSVIDTLAKAIRGAATGLGFPAETPLGDIKRVITFLTHDLEQGLWDLDLILDDLTQLEKERGRALLIQRLIPVLPLPPQAPQLVTATPAGPCAFVERDGETFMVSPKEVLAGSWIIQPKYRVSNYLIVEVSGREIIIPFDVLADCKRALEHFNAKLGFESPMTWYIRPKGDTWRTFVSYLQGRARKLPLGKVTTRCGWIDSGKLYVVSNTLQIAHFSFFAASGPDWVQRITQTRRFYKDSAEWFVATCKESNVWVYAADENHPSLKAGGWDQPLLKSTDAWENAHRMHEYLQGTCKTIVYPDGQNYPHFLLTQSYVLMCQWRPHMVSRRHFPNLLAVGPEGRGKSTGSKAAESTAMPYDEHHPLHCGDDCTHEEAATMLARAKDVPVILDDTDSIRRDKLCTLLKGASGAPERGPAIVDMNDDMYKGMRGAALRRTLILHYGGTQLTLPSLEDEMAQFRKGLFALTPLLAGIKYDQILVQQILTAPWWKDAVVPAIKRLEPKADEVDHAAWLCATILYCEPMHRCPAWRVRMFALAFDLCLVFPKEALTLNEVLVCSDWRKEPLHVSANDQFVRCITEPLLAPANDQYVRCITDGGIQLHAQAWAKAADGGETVACDDFTLLHLDGRRYWLRREVCPDSTKNSKLFQDLAAKYAFVKHLDLHFRKSASFLDPASVYRVEKKTPVWDQVCREANLANSGKDLVVVCADDPNLMSLLRVADAE